MKRLKLKEEPVKEMGQNTHDEHSAKRCKRKALIYARTGELVEAMAHNLSTDVCYQDCGILVK